MKRPVIWPNQFLKDERGGVLILVVVLIVVLLGVSALAVDAGALYQTRREMVNAADSAALAGAQQLHRNLTGIDNQDVISYTEGFATGNYGCDDATATVNNLEVEVITEKNVELFFARFLGIDDVDVSSRAVAKIGKLTEGNIMPFGMCLSTFENLTTGALHNVVDFPSASYGAGNWGWLKFHTPQTKHKTIEYLADGYDAYIGMPINTDTGANVTAGNTKAPATAILNGYKDNETLLWVPITGSMGPGQSSPSTIVGFAVIIITDFDFGPPNAFQKIEGQIIAGIFDAEALDTQGDYSIFYPSGVALIQ